MGPHIQRDRAEAEPVNTAAWPHPSTAGRISWGVPSCYRKWWQRPKTVQEGKTAPGAVKYKLPRLPHGPPPTPPATPAPRLTVSSCLLSTGFWDSALNSQRSSGSPVEPQRDPAPGAPAPSTLRSASHYENCSCEIELTVGNDRLWFVNPIFIEDCGSALPARLPPPGSCPSHPSPPTSDATSPTSKWAPRTHHLPTLTEPAQT